MRNAMSNFGGSAMAPLRRLRRDFDRFFSDWPEGQGEAGLWDNSFEPSVDVHEDKDSLVVRAELPGMNKEDIKVSLENGMLTLQGERREEKEGKDKGLLRREISYGSFYRSFSLPSGVDSSKAAATYKNGILELKLPKKEEAKPRNIEISVQ